MNSVDPIKSCEYGCAKYNYMGIPSCHCIEGAELINGICEFSSETRTTKVLPTTTSTTVTTTTLPGEFKK